MSSQSTRVAVAAASMAVTAYLFAACGSTTGDTTSDGPTSAPPVVSGLVECQRFAELAGGMLQEAAAEIENVTSGGGTSTAALEAAIQRAGESADACRAFGDSDSEQVQACLTAGGDALQATQWIVRALDVGGPSPEEQDLLRAAVDAADFYIDEYAAHQIDCF